MSQTPFVAREKELGRLVATLGEVQAGCGRLCFITGEAGAGKTSLTAEFARRAQHSDPELLFVVGNCNAQSGIGDPYLPFREVLAQLTGDVDSKLTQGAISAENAGRLKGFLTFSGRALVDLGPDLIDIFVPGAALVSRAGKLVAGEVGWRKRLEALHRKNASRPEDILPARGGHQAMEQNQIFEQFTRVLVELARLKPLVLLIDDLHWADESSASLLFHLARRIDSSRILVLGTYRPEDVALGRGERRHPLEAVVSEIKRLHGEVLLPLDNTGGAEGRSFIDALLDTQPNRLDEDFREQLLKHTRGHPLFTTELLRGMHNRGDLVLAADGHLERGPALDWEALPARIEGVIEERIHRIPADLQELLTVASVEGEQFTAQVLAQVLNMGEREVLQALDRDLDRNFHVVQEHSLQRVGRQRISQYRFRHNLIQRYLYGGIGESRRELLHEDVARALEGLYGTASGDIAVQLARHFELAQLPEAAADHYLDAGRRAMQMFAADEAAAVLAHGLELISELPVDSAHERRTVALQLALGQAQWKQGLAPESMTTFSAAANTARRLGAADELAQAALGYDDTRFRFNFPVAPAVKLLEEALQTLGEGDSVLRVRVVCGLIRAQGHRMIPIVVKTLTEQAIAMARRLGDDQALYTALLIRALAYPQAERLDERLALLGETVLLARRIGDRAALLDAYVFLLDNLLAKGDVEAVDREFLVMQELVDEVGEPFYDYCLVTKLAMRSLLSGDFAGAERLAQQGMACSQQMVVDNAEGVFGMQMFSIRRLQGSLRTLAPVIRQFVSTHSDAASWRPGLALVYAEIGDEPAARAEFEALAPNDFAAIPRDSLWQTCLSYLADVCCFLGDGPRAAVLYRLLLPWAGQAIVVGNSITCNGAASRCLGRLATLMQDWDAAARHFEHAIAFNEQLRALPWLAHTHRQYADMLLLRRQPGDEAGAITHRAAARNIAQTLGMQALLHDLGGD